jgi:hypothetical protein
MKFKAHAILRLESPRFSFIWISPAAVEDRLRRIEAWWTDVGIEGGTVVISRT